MSNTERTNQIAAQIEQYIRNKISEIDIDRKVLENHLASLPSFTEHAVMDTVVLLRSMAKIKSGENQRAIIGHMLDAVKQNCRGCGLILLGSEKPVLWLGPGFGLNPGEPTGSKRLNIQVTANSPIANAVARGEVILSNFDSRQLEHKIYESLNIDVPVEIAYIPMTVNASTQALVVADNNTGPVKDPAALAVMVGFAAMCIETLPFRKQIGNSPLPVYPPRREAPQVVEDEDKDPFDTSYVPTDFPKVEETSFAPPELEPQIIESPMQAPEPSYFAEEAEEEEEEEITIEYGATDSVGIELEEEEFETVEESESDAAPTVIEIDEVEGLPPAEEDITLLEEPESVIEEETVIEEEEEEEYELLEEPGDMVIEEIPIPGPTLPDIEIKESEQSEELEEAEEGEFEEEEFEELEDIEEEVVVEEVVEEEEEPEPVEMYEPTPPPIPDYEEPAEEPADEEPKSEPVTAVYAGLELSGYDFDQYEGEEKKLHEKAARFARLLVSEIKLYNEDAVKLGRENADLATRLNDDIQRSLALYEQRIPESVRSVSDYFNKELIRQLADGNESLFK